jgi:hypothetical protein
MRSDCSDGKEVERSYGGGVERNSCSGMRIRGGQEHQERLANRDVFVEASSRDYTLRAGAGCASERGNWETLVFPCRYVDV